MSPLESFKDYILFVVGGIMSLGGWLLKRAIHKAEQRHQALEDRCTALEDTVVTKVDLERVVETMDKQRTELHLENKETLKEIKEDLSYMRDRVDRADAMELAHLRAKADQTKR